MRPNQNQNDYSAVIASPIGKLGLKFTEGKLTALNFLKDAIKLKQANDKAVWNVTDALENYFKDPHYSFKQITTLHLSGSIFQMKVWQALQNIPSGETLTYGELAKKLVSAPRAIGQACRWNPVPILVPCHRIIAATHAGGYSGAREGKLMDIKHWLLNHEKVLLGQS